MESQGYEKSDVAINKVFMWAGAIAVFIIVIVIVLNSFFTSQMEKQVYESVLKPESVELRDLRARETETLNSYKVIDEQKDIVQIPIDRAMQLLADEAFAERMKQSR